jgi:hypothetical protein
MLYAQVARRNGAILKFPIRSEELADLLNVSLPSDKDQLEAMDLTHLGIFKVPGADLPPSSGPGKKFVLAEPVWQAGELVRQFSEVDRAQDEVDKAWKNLRARRNGLLRATDWSQAVSDIPDATRQAFVDYRQALRDLPVNTTDPFNVQWPVGPGDDAT